MTHFQSFPSAHSPSLPLSVSLSSLSLTHSLSHSFFLLRQSTFMSCHQGGLCRMCCDSAETQEKRLLPHSFSFTPLSPLFRAAWHRQMSVWGGATSGVWSSVCLTGVAGTWPRSHAVWLVLSPLTPLSTSVHFPLPVAIRLALAVGSTPSFTSDRSLLLFSSTHPLTLSFTRWCYFCLSLYLYLLFFPLLLCR